jgi:hypothetical protein
LAVNFVNLADLDEADLKVVERLGQAALVATKVRHEPVQHLDWNRPKEVVSQVSERVPGFNMSHHTDAWRRHGVRPDSEASDPAPTDARYCIYDRAHGDYVYSNAWVRKLIAELVPAPETASAAVPRPSIASAGTPAGTAAADAGGALHRAGDASHSASRAGRSSMTVTPKGTAPDRSDSA